MPNKKHKKVTVTFDEGQLPIVVRALEIFMRMRSGQITIALDEAYADKQTALMHDENYSHRQSNHAIEQLIRNIYFKDLKYEDAAWGVGQLGYGADEAYTICKTIRQYLAYERNGGYCGSGVDFNIGCTYGKFDRPEIHGFSTRKFFKAPKRLQAQMQKLFAEKKYVELFDLVDHKWKSLPDGEKYEVNYQLPDDASEHYNNIGVWVTAPKKERKL